MSSQISSLSSSLSIRLQSLYRSILNHPLLKDHPVVVAALAAGSAPILYFINSDYRDWLRLGQGGPPHNFIGYFLQSVLRPLKAKRFDTTVYDNPKIVAKSGPHAETSYLSLDDIPQREGARPEVGKWILPQRQLDNKSSEEAKKRYETLIRSLAASDPTSLSVKTSILERGGLALFINPEVKRHDGARWTQNEITHLHPSDGSMHVSLAPKDAKLVIERGWGERFGLSGLVFPVTYVMVYAPRSGDGEEEDLKVVEKIIRAGVKFMLGETKEG